MNTETCTCPNCGTTLFEDTDLAHDGYMGSPYAHNGRGSLGLARHHYYFVCECGWSERPEISRRKRLASLRRERRASYTWNGVRLPGSAKDISECVVLPCSSRQSKAERLADMLARESGDYGVGTGHSLCSSYTYTIVKKDVLECAQRMIATGAFKGCNYSWEFRDILHRDEVYNCDDH